MLLNGQQLTILSGDNNVSFTSLPIVFPSGSEGHVLMVTSDGTPNGNVLESYIYDADTNTWVKLSKAETITNFSTPVVTNPTANTINIALPYNQEGGTVQNVNIPITLPTPVSVVNSIDFKPTANANEFTVEITYTNDLGVQTTITDTTPVIFPRGAWDNPDGTPATQASTTINYTAGNVGIGITAPLNKLHIGTPTVVNTGGIRLPITSASAGQVGQPIGVDANGDIVRLTPTTFDATVSFSTATPTTPGVVFTPNTPANTTVLYVSSIDGSQWTYNGTTYVTAPVSNDWKITGNAGTVQATNFVGTTDNVGLSFRTANVIRQTITNTGNVGIATTTPLFKLSNTAISILDGGPGLGTGTALSGIGWSIAEAGYAVGIENIATSAFSNGLTVRTASVNPLTSILSVGSSNIRRMVVQGNGNVGIGTTTPATLFHVNGTSTFAGGATISGTTGATWISMPSVGLSGIGTTNAIWAANVINTSNYFTGALAGDTAHRNLTGKLLFGNTTGAPAMAITGNNVGMGTLAPTQKLHVIGNIIASGTITPSDKRLKSNIKDVQYGVKELLKLKPVSYTKKFSLDKVEKGEVKEFGFIAQDLQKVLPELVTENGEDKLLAVNYNSFIPILIKSIQEQQVLIQDLQEQILKIKNK